MTQVSKNEVDVRVRRMMWGRLVGVVQREHGGQAAEALLLGLLTDTERLVVVKRLMAGILLLSGWEVVAIAEVLKLSRSSIHKYQSMLEVDREYRKLLMKMFPEKIRYDKVETKGGGTSKYLLGVLESLGYLAEDMVVGYHHRSRLIYGDPTR